MKKLLFSAMALFAAMSLVSCDPSEIVDSISGNVSLTISCEGVDNHYTDGQTIDFSSSVTDIITDSALAEMVFLGANINLTESNASIAAPYLGFVVADTVIGTYQIDNVMTPENIATFAPQSLLTNLSGNNVFLLIASDTSFYLAKAGSITLSDYPSIVIEPANGTFNNVQCYYVTDSKMAYIKNLLNDANAGDPAAIATLATLNIDELFPTVTFNGTFSSRRMIVQTLLDNLDSETPQE